MLSQLVEGGVPLGCERRGLPWTGSLAGQGPVEVKNRTVQNEAQHEKRARQRLSREGELFQLDKCVQYSKLMVWEIRRKREFGKERCRALNSKLKM